MAALTLTLKRRPPERLDLSDVLPDRLAGLGLQEIRALPIGTTRTGVTIGDVFEVSGEPGDTLVFEGGSDRFDNVGRSLTSGSITVRGDVGAYCGRGMKGGRIAVDGSLTGPYAGTMMTAARSSLGRSGRRHGRFGAGRHAGNGGWPHRDRRFRRRLSW